MSAAGAFESDYFERVYRNYERQNPIRKLAFYSEILNTHVPPTESRRILDLGCAVGKFLGHLDPSWQKFGIDLSEYAIRRATEALPDARFAVGSCTHVPFPGPYDAIVAFDVLEHVPDLDSVARDITSFLDKKGTFLFLVPVYDGPLGPVVELLDRDPTHVHKRSRNFWLTWADRWFDIQEWYGVFRYLLPMGPYLHYPSQMLKDISPAILVAVRPKLPRN